MSADHLAKGIVSTIEVLLYLLLYSARIVSVEREFRGCPLETSVLLARIFPVFCAS